MRTKEPRHEKLDAFLRAMNADPGRPGFDGQLKLLVAKAKECRTNDPEFLDQLVAMRDSLEHPSAYHPDHQVRNALSLASSAIGYALAFEIIAAHPDLPTDLTIRLKAAHQIVGGHATLASALQVIQPGNIGVAVHALLKNIAPVYLKISDAERPEALEKVTHALATVLPRKPSTDIVREALEVVTYRGGKNGKRSKWEVLADLLRDVGVQVASALSLKQAVAEHAG